MGNEDEDRTTSSIEFLSRREGEPWQDERSGIRKENDKFSLPFYKLFSFADSIDIILMILGSAGAIANGCVMPLSMILFGDIINSYGDTDISNMAHSVSKGALNLFYLAVGSGVASFIQLSCWIVTGERQAARIRTLYFRALLKQDIAFFDMETDTGEVVWSMSGDIILIQGAMGEQVGKFINLIATFLTAFIFAFVKGWLFTLIMLSTFPPMVVCGAIMTIVLSKISSSEQKAYDKGSEVVEQTISSIRTVASFTGEKLSVLKYNKALNSAYNASIYESLTTGLGTGLVMCITYCGYAFGLWKSADLVLHKGYTGGDVMAVVFIVLLGALALGQASPCFTAFTAGQAAAYRIFETIKRKPEIDAYDRTGKELEDIHGDIEFRNVYFSYPARPDEQIFRGFSLSIHRGTTVALVGESGSGKSTVISLIERFYDPQAGQVLIDGINIKEFQLRWLRGKIGIVSQEPVLFTSSIRDNIAYGKDNATIGEIRAAAELANASRFINMIPQGLDALVGEHGAQLSGGQKQRIAIARAILKDPKILLLDEATSALDVESEQIVQEAIDRIMVNRSTIIVAHRLNTVRNAGSIAVIHQGSIIEKGSHSELVKDLNGAYSKLIRLQEMNQGFDKKPLNENDNGRALVDGIGSASHRMSFRNPISRESSMEHASSRYSFIKRLGQASFGHSSHHYSFKIGPGQSSFRHSSRHYSFKVAIGVPIEIDVQGSKKEHQATIPSEKSHNVPLGRLAYLNKPEIPMLFIGSVAAIINGVVFPMLGLIFAGMIVTFYQPPLKMKKDSKLWSLMFLIVGVVSLIGTLGRSYFFGVAGSKLIRRIRLMTFEKVVNMEMAWFDNPENSSGEIGARLSADAAKVRSLVGDGVSLIVQNIAALIGGLIIAFAACWEISLIILAMVPLLGLNAWIQMKFIRGFSADSEKMFLGASQVASDAVGNIRTVASFSAEERVVELYKKKCNGPMKLGIRQGVVSGIGFGISQLFLYSAYAAILYFGALLVQDGKSTFEKIFRAFFVLVIATVGIFQSTSQGPDSDKARAATASVFTLIDRKSKIDPSTDDGITLDTLEGNIRFDHVAFKYPTRPNIQIFQDFSLEIKAGKTIALVGESGSGKSTAIALLQRFYDPDTGHILLDGINLHEFRIQWLRQQMGLVSQEPVLLNDTIHANIAYGKQDGEATQAEILAASELANAHNFISSLQQGYDTLVGERGVQLSGGQKQRVAIARAVIKQPHILLLDEATSALDAESEQVVQDALNQIMVNRTTIMVTHRLTAIKNTNLIAVVKNGMIVEKGRHDVLKNLKNGVYASMVALHKSSSS